MRPMSRIFIKLVEVAACLSCVIAKAITDQEAKRTFLLNQKLSREWSLIHNVTWSLAGNSFANVTYGGYTLITSLMAISRLIESRSPPTIIEKIFLTLGMVFFLIMGGMVLAAIDQVPHALIDNAIVMGLLSFLVAFIFLIDLSDPLPMRRVSHAQTSTNATHEMGIQADEVDQTNRKNGGAFARNISHGPHPTVGIGTDKDYPRQPTLPAERRPPAVPAHGARPPVHPPQLPLQPRPVKHQPNRVAPEEIPNTASSQTHITLSADSFPRSQEPVVSHLLTPEKMRAQKSKVSQKGAFIVEEVPKNRRCSGNLSEDDTMSRISSHSYVKTSEVDTLPSYDRPSASETNKGQDEVDSPIVPGYVASTAKMWNKRSTLGANTRV